MFQIAICDDDKYVCAALERILLDMEPHFQEKIEIEVFYSGQDLWKQLYQDDYTVELLFLDIQMKYLNGIELGKMIRDTLGNELTQIVYISNYDSYAMELFQVRPLHFLRKPLEQQQVLDVVEKAWELLGKRKQYYCYLSGKEMHRVLVTDILYFSSQGKKVTIHMQDGNREFYGKLSNVIEELREYHFLSIHKSYLVNFVYISSIQRSQVILTNGEILPISHSKREAVHEFVLATVRSQIG